MRVRTRNEDGVRDGAERCLCPLAHVQHVEQTRTRRAVDRRLVGAHEGRVSQRLEHTLVLHYELGHRFRLQLGRLARELHGRDARRSRRRRRRCNGSCRWGVIVVVITGARGGGRCGCGGGPVRDGRRRLYGGRQFSFAYKG